MARARRATFVLTIPAITPELATLLDKAQGADP